MMRTLLLLILVHPAIAQLYPGKNGKTRHRFAQTVMGLDFQTMGGGSTYLPALHGGVHSSPLGVAVNPRIYISGMHFWGHAEFYFAFQVPFTARAGSGEFLYRQKQTDIFGTKVYPWAVRQKRLRPFIGTAIAGVTYRQWNAATGVSGPLTANLIAPVMAGLNYCRGAFLYEIMFSYNHDHKMVYYPTPLLAAPVRTHPYSISVGVRAWLETTLASEKRYLDGSTEREYAKLSRESKLSSWFWGAGYSSAFYTKTSEFNERFYPFMGKPWVTTFPEVSAGYFFERAGIHTAAAVRYNRARKTGFGVTQVYSRASISLEAFKYFFDYHGFNPFGGVSLSGERLGFTHISDSLTQGSSVCRPAAGLVFGWDILPDKLQGFVLRTNLRYFPALRIDDVLGKSVSLSQFEFNFIQLVVYPQRLKRLRETQRH